MYLQGQELQNFLNYKKTGSIAPTGVSGMIQNVFSPFTKFANQTNQLGANVLSGLGMAQRGEYMTPQEIEQWKSNPITGTVKPIAGMAAFAVPGGGGLLGGGIKGLIASGALSGALSGFGMSEQGQELGGAVKGGVAGGAIGGILGLASKGLEKLSKGQKLTVAEQKMVKEQGLEKLLADRLKNRNIASEIPEDFVKRVAPGSNASGNIQIINGIGEGGTKGIKIQLENALNANDAGLAKALYNKLPKVEQTSMYSRQIEKMAGQPFDKIIAKSSVATAIPDEQIAQTVAQPELTKALPELSKKQQLGLEMRLKSLGTKPPTTPTGIQIWRKDGQKLLNILDSNNLPTNAEGIGLAYNQLSDNFTNVVKNNKTIINTKPILDDFMNKASLEVDDLSKGAASKVTELMKNKLNALGNSTNASDLAALKFNIQGEMSGIYKKINRGTPLSDKENIIFAFHNAVDDVLKNSVPESRQLLSDMSLLHKVAPDIIKSSTKAVYLGGPMMPVRINVGGLVKKGENTVGKMLMGQNSNIGKILSKLKINGKGIDSDTLLNILLNAQKGLNVAAPIAAKSIPILIMSQQSGLPYNENTGTLGMVDENGLGGLNPQFVQAALQEQQGNNFTY